MSETKFLSKTGLETLVTNLKSYIQTYYCNCDCDYYYENVCRHSRCYAKGFDETCDDVYIFQDSDAYFTE